MLLVYPVFNFLEGHIEEKDPVNHRDPFWFFLTLDFIKGILNIVLNSAFLMLLDLRKGDYYNDL